MLSANTPDNAKNTPPPHTVMISLNCSTYDVGQGLVSDVGVVEIGVVAALLDDLAVDHH